MEYTPLADTTDHGSHPSERQLVVYMEESAARHHHLCPRQVLGIRMGLFGLKSLGLIDDDYEPRFHNTRKSLLTIVETDGCGADGVAVATGCFVGRRTLRVVDYGKMAATMVNIKTGTAVRVVPHPEARNLARTYVPDARSRWHAYLNAYQIIPDNLLMLLDEVILTQSIAEIMSKPNVRVNCELCGEEILNEREVKEDDRLLCRSCAGESYYCEL